LTDARSVWGRAGGGRLEPVVGCGLQGGPL
jgi:hypothetical protein